MGNAAVSSAPRAVSRRAGPLRWLLHGAIIVGVLWLLLRPSAPSARAVDAAWDDWSAVQEIFAFGDSWTTTDFDVDGPQPDESNPMGNPAFRNDPTKAPPDWLTYLTGFYNASFVRTYNLAHGAATIDRELVAPLFGRTATLVEQVDELYLARYAGTQHASAPWPPPHRLVAVFMGLVDLTLLSREISTNVSIVDDLARAYERALLRLHDGGARHFLLLTVPPLDMAPDPANLDILAALLRSFNARVRRAAAALRAARPDAAVRLFDLDVFLQRLARDPPSMPQTAGIRNVSRSCWEYNPDLYVQTPQPWAHFDPRCGIPRDEYFWANALHLTHPVQEAIAARIVGDCFGPPAPRTGLRGWGLCA